MKNFIVLGALALGCAQLAAQSTSCGDTILICAGTQETIHFDAAQYDVSTLQFTVSPSIPFTTNLSDTSMTITLSSPGIFQIRAQASAISPICPPLDCSMFYNVVNITADIASPADDCQHTGTLSLLPFGTPSGGTWLINGSPGTSIDYSIPGTYNLQYSISGAGGCSATDTGSFTIYAAPIVNGFRRQ